MPISLTMKLVKDDLPYNFCIRTKIDTDTVVSLSTEMSILLHVTKPASWLGTSYISVRTSPRVTTSLKMNGLVVSLSAETFLNTGQCYLVTKPST